MENQPEVQELTAKAAWPKAMLCTTCIEEWIKRPDEEKENLVPREHIREADTIVPSWQTNMIGPGQLVMACIGLPTCLEHIVPKRATPEEIAQRNGLWAPGQN